MRTEKTNGPRARAECKSNSCAEADVRNSWTSSQSILPVNLAAERCVLGAVVEEESYLSDLLSTGLTRDDFFLSEHRRVFDALTSLHARKAPIDYLTLAEELGNTQEAYGLVAGLMQGIVLHEGHVRYHTGIVRRKARLRKILKLGEWIREAVTEAADPDVLLSQIRETLETCTEDELRA